MNILIYFPSSYNSVFILTVIDDLIKKQHSVYLLTTTPYGILQEGAEKLGAKVYAGNRSNDIYHLFKEMYQLIKFCRKHQIDYVFSHLQYLNLVAVCSRFFIKASVFPMRHHADDVYLTGNKNAKLLDQLVNIFSRKILVVSPACRIHMTKYEKVPEKKIIILPSYYNFQFYNLLHLTVDRNQLSYTDNALHLINIGRMVKNKNHITLLIVMQKLVKEGMNIILNLLDEGPLESELKEFVRNAGLTENVFFLGRKTDVLSYIRTADLLVHTSISESAGQVVKEAGVCQVPVIVVKGTGDFDEYIIDKENGFFVSKDNMADELYQVLKFVYQNKFMLKEMGEKLGRAVIDNFDVANAQLTYTNIIDKSIYSL